jgi:hypothetical protein
MSDVFLSYSSEDRAWANLLADCLQKQGWSIWWDRTIPAGKTFIKVISEALSNARSVVVIWSHKSVDSDWVQEEAEKGRKRGILVPVLKENVEPPMGFGLIQAADLSGWDGDLEAAEFKKLIQDLTGILSSPNQQELPSGPETARPVPKMPDDQISINPEVIALGKKVLSKLDETRNTGDGFDYWPLGGIQIAYYHLATFVGYEKLVKLSPYPIFLSGPHGTENLNLKARFSFGHYNPDFLRWFSDQLMEILQDRAFVKTTSPLFKRYLSMTAKAYWATYKILNENPEELNTLLLDYKTRIDNRTLPSGYYYNIAWEEARNKFVSLKALGEYYASNVTAPAVYFWLRRIIDGSHEQFFSMLESLLEAYQEIENRLYFDPKKLPRVT